jgi:hypothetical protein
MATHVLRGDAQVVRDLWTITPGASNNAVYTVTINGKDVTYTADASALVAEITAGLVAALQASTIPEFMEVTWADGTTVLTGTGPATGKPVVITCSASAGSLTPVNTTPAEGPNHVIAVNFDTGSLPASNDTLILQDSAVSLLYTLDKSAVVLDLLLAPADYTGKLGLPQLTASNGYYEYRDTYFAIGADEVRIGEGNGDGSGLIKLDLGSGQTLVQVFKTGNADDRDYGAVQLLATHANNELRVFAGTVDVAMGPGQVSTFATIRATGGQVRCGAGVTLTTVEANGTSTVEVRSAATTLKTQDSGQIKKLGSGAIGTVEVAGGLVEYSAGGTITTLIVRSNCTFDASKLAVAVTITNSTAYDRATIKDPNGMITWTNPTSCPDGAQSVTFVSKKGATVKVA